MSSTKFWSVSSGTVTRTEDDGSGGQGCGGSKRLYVGRAGASGSRRNYDSFLKFTLDWANVGKIVSATLILYTDDGLGLFPSTTNERPRASVRRLTSAFTEGNNADGTFDSSDYTNPSRTSTGISASLTRAAAGQNRINITSIVNGWAPKTVKQSSGKPGAGLANHGIGLFGTSDTGQNWAGFSEDYTDALVRPQIELVYELGPTVPSTPTNLSPSGAVASIGAFQGDFADARSTDYLRSSSVQVYDAGVTGTASAVTDAITKTGHGLQNLDQIYITSAGVSGLSTFARYYVRNRTATTFKLSTTTTGATVAIAATGAVVYSKLLYNKTQAASNTEVINDRFDHIPDDFNPVRNTNYRWRARVTDQEGQVSLWTALTTFSVTNTDPNAPVLDPATATTYATLDGVLFRGGTFSDPDAGDKLLAYQIQLSAYPSGDAHWDDAEFILWNTGKVYVASGATEWERVYGGQALDAGTYYWRARQWDTHDGVSNWTYASITLSANFQPDPEQHTDVQQVRPRAPWRIVIKAMGSLRGPGAVVAILENAKSVGASLLYNSPGEAHWTLPIDHPQISVIEPKQTHYSIQFYTGDGWREKFAGLVWDFDATERDVVFYGIDYLALYDYVMDERYDASQPNKPAEKGGSYYVTNGKNTIGYIVTDQLTRAKNLKNSPVGFITIGSIASMTAKVAIYSTMQPTLQFVTGLLESHRGGADKRTRVQVRPKTGGGYEVIVQDAPGQVRDNLRLRYGELVQGYRVIPFGADWATRINTIGRSRDGIKVLYQRAASGLDEATWGRFAKATIVNDVSDASDLLRRTKQLSIAAGKLGKQIGLGIRTGVLGPRDGYDVTDIFPVAIQHGSVDTTNFGSGYWVCVGVTWEATDDGNQNVSLTFRPREDGVAPSGDLLELQDISPQKEWQVGWSAPNPLSATSEAWYDGTTGKVYKRTAGSLLIEDTLTGTA